MKKTVLITGSSRGIGLALANIFLQHNFHVIGTGRAGKTEESTHPDYKLFALDLSQNESIQSFAKQILDSHIKIDILINNAGIGPDLDTHLPQYTTMRETFDVNVFGTVFLTEALLPSLAPNGKIINITSKMGSMDNCKTSDSVAYRMSKSALNMYTQILTNRLRGTHDIAGIHPGWVRTTIAPSSIYGRLSPEESALKIVDFVTNDFESGIYWDIESQSILEW